MHHNLCSNWLDVKGNFHTNTQVWNSLNHRNDRQQRGLIRVTYGCYKDKPLWVRNISQYRRSSAPPRALVRPTTTDRNQTPLRSQRLHKYDDSLSYNPATPNDGHSNHPQTAKKHAYPKPARQPLMFENCKNPDILARIAVNPKYIKVRSRTINHKNGISQQLHSNFDLRNAPYPSRTYAAIPPARGILLRYNETERPNPGTSNSDTWHIFETKVSEHNSISYWDEDTVKSLRFLARPRTEVQIYNNRF